MKEYVYFILLLFILILVIFIFNFRSYKEGLGEWRDPKFTKHPTGWDIEDNTTYYGYDMISPPAIATPLECISKCAVLPLCKAAQYNGETNQCYLKSNLGKRGTDSRFYTYKKNSDFKSPQQLEKEATERAAARAAERASAREEARAAARETARAEAEEREASRAVAQEEARAAEREKARENTAREAAAKEEALRQMFMTIPTSISSVDKKISVLNNNYGKLNNKYGKLNTDYNQLNGKIDHHFDDLSSQIKMNTDKLGNFVGPNDLYSTLGKFSSTNTVYSSINNLSSQMTNNKYILNTIVSALSSLHNDVSVIKNGLNSDEEKNVVPSDQKCISDYNTEIDENAQFVCPASKPKCIGFELNKSWGTCR